MIEDLFVPDPPAGDSSNRIADTRFVQSTIASAIATAPSNLPSITGLSVIGNASTVSATAAAITGAADQLLAVNHAATTVFFTSVSSYLDNAIGSTAGRLLYRNSASWVATAPAFTTVFTSSQQVITAAASAVLAHSLGTTPILIQARLVNQTAEVGYSAADELVIDLGATDGGANNRGLSVVPDATNVNIRFGSAAPTFNIINKTSGANVGITNASWKIMFRAWA